MNLLQRLTQNIEGDVSAQPSVLAAYAVDESIFTCKPQVVIAPKSTRDLQTLIEIANDFDVTVVPRGGGSGTTGAALGDQVVVDCRTYMNRILSIDEETAWVQPGVFLSELNQHVARQGLVFGPDPGSRDYACMGGVVGNNAAGAHALVYGMTRDHVQEIKCVLSSGEVLSTTEMPTRFAGLTTAMQQARDMIEQSRVKVSKNSSGLYLEAFLQNKPNFARLLCGSEGKLALSAEMAVKLSPSPECRSFAIYGFADKIEAAHAVHSILESGPACIELIDDVIQHALSQADFEMASRLGMNRTGASLWVEWFDDQQKQQDMHYFSTDRAQIESIWKFRSHASKVLHSMATHRHPLRCIEDGCVPIDALPLYIAEVDALLEQFDCKGAVFGHIGNGHLHINPSIDVTAPDLQQRIHTLMDQFYAVVLSYNGSISGEHGDGCLRKKYATQQWQQRADLFEQVYQAFDPQQRFVAKREPQLRDFWPI